MEKPKKIAVKSGPGNLLNP